MKNPLANPIVIRRIMQENGLQFQKKFGQNFLTDESVLAEIASASGVTKEDAVLEIGPGLGALTWELAQRANRVIALEIDSGMAAALQNEMEPYPQVTVLQQDILKTNLQALIDEALGGTPPYVAANLPYYITTPIIMSLLESRIAFPRIVIMIQKEVAERIVASPGSKAYGVLTVAANYYAQTEILLTVPAASFIPAPQVDSAVLSLTPRPHPDCHPKSEATFFKTVKGAFAQRRKTLLNSLTGSGCLQGSKEEIAKALDACGIDPKLRGEALSLCQLGDLSDALVERKIL